MLNGFYDTSVAPILMRNYDTKTLGNDFKLIHNRSKLDIKKYSFSNRIVSLWNKRLIGLYSLRLLMVLRIIWINSGYPRSFTITGRQIFVNI